ncbi:hypothetical protein Tco_0642535 [Tanacetum coccineum]
MGNGVNIRFWEDKWRGDNTFQSDFPRMYALETQKNISVALKLSHDDLMCSFRRAPRAGAKELQYIQLVKIMEGFTLFNSKDRWRWSLEGCSEFTVASVRNLLDANSLPVVSSKTRWIKVVPIKVNIHAWKVKLDILPTRLNISKRGMDIDKLMDMSNIKEFRSKTNTRRHMTDQEAKERNQLPRLREIMPQPSTVNCS